MAAKPQCLTAVQPSVSTDTTQPDTTQPDTAQSGSTPRRGRSEEGPRERGFVLVWIALMLFMLLAVAGFAVDLGNWWLQSTKLQNAVDAGAHAGAVFLPDNEPEAVSKAFDEVAKNGFNDHALPGPSNATVHAEQMPNPYQLRVEATTTIDNFFLSLIGFDTQTLTRDAVGEFELPIAMGSPQNKIGNDPEEGDLDSQFWLNLAGPGEDKINGDRYQTKYCSTSTANCTGTRNPGIKNDDYSFDGYFFTVDVKNVVPGEDLNIDVFDAAMTHVGNFCETNRLPNAGQRAALAALPGNPYPDAQTRFAPGTTQWCTGDSFYAGGKGDARTSFIVREPDDTPWSVTDNPIVNAATCSPMAMPAYPGATGTRVYQYLDPFDGNYDAEGIRNPNDGVLTFAETFRQWATLCSIPAGTVQEGKYIIQMRTNASPATPLTYNSSVKTYGFNRMSMRVGFGADSAVLDGSNVSISARTRLPIYANADDTNTTFPLARLTPNDAGRTMRVTLFDMGDANNAGTLRVLAPSESTSEFVDCKFTRNDGANLNVSSNCQLNNVRTSTGFNGRIVTVDVPIPEDYDCNVASGTGCWTRVLSSFPGSGTHDVTTWSATILGSPVRLVE
ncbi:MAG: pilus assembly protein TadG-related protein [Microthrixaceae bacterium]